MTKVNFEYIQEQDLVNSMKVPANEFRTKQNNLQLTSEAGVVHVEYDKGPYIKAVTKPQKVGMNILYAVFKGAVAY